MKKIADICQHDRPIDWEIAREDLDLIIFRASEGYEEDKRYLEYTTQCGVPYGAYHYVKASTAKEAKEEAIFFVQCANKAYQKPLFYIADIESKAQTSETTEPVCVAFLQELRALGCQKIGMYINRRYKWAGKAIDLCDIMWIPHWGKNDGNIPNDAAKPKYYNDLWQYTSEGLVEGIGETVDLNLLNGNKDLSYFTKGWVKPTKEEMLYLKKKSSGEEVKNLQSNLNLILKTKLKNDGVFGSKTEEALKQFQEKYNLEVNGIYTYKTHIILKQILSEAQYDKKYVTSTSINVRVGDNINCEKIINLPKNTILNVVLDKNNNPIISINNWYAIYLDNQIGWINGNYVKENI